MKTEIEFLEQIKKEFDTGEYGEGISFNLNGIVGTINDRIKQVKKLSKANVIKSVCQCTEAEYSSEHDYCGKCKLPVRE